MTLCTLCKRKDAVFMRPYSGERLCETCFCESIEGGVRTTISRYDMLKFNDKIMVAVSGGKDSVALLNVLAKMERRFPEAELSAVTVDEGIKGYRDEALKFAVKNCRDLDVKHAVTSFKELYGYELDEIVAMTRKGELSPCSYCGVLRRRALNATAREAGVDKLATAHNLDDEVQTIFLNIIRGDAARIARVKPVLEYVHPKLVSRIKPLCEVPEKEISLFAYLKQIEFQSIPCPYARTSIRSDIRTMLNRMEEEHPSTKFTIFRSVEKIKPALVNAAEKMNIQECKSCGEPTSGEICKACQMLQELAIL
jgi:uncharacterized protein (TIGR00269 family)